MRTSLFYENIPVAQERERMMGEEKIPEHKAFDRCGQCGEAYMLHNPESGECPVGEGTRFRSVHVHPVPQSEYTKEELDQFIK